MLNEQEYNVCNLYLEGKQPSDYYEKLEKTYTRNWIDIFHVDYSVCTIDNKWALDIIKQAYSIGKHTYKVPKGYLEELEIIAENIVKRLTKTCDFDLNKKYFVRAENVSLKTGIHKAGPYTSILQVLQSLITCNEKHSPIIENSQGGINPITLYFLPWVEIDLEFRVFVYNGKITGISQQHWYEVKYHEERESEKPFKNRYEKFTERIPEFTGFCNKTVKSLKEWKNHPLGFTMDIALLKSGEFYFIEVNGFGAEYSAGSSLFHWKRDNLEDTEKIPEYRYLVDFKEL